MLISSLFKASTFLAFFIVTGCVEDNHSFSNQFEIPQANHDLGYIPFDNRTDDSNYTVCDSTNINSGRNGIQYIGGTSQLKQDIASQFTYKKEYETFNGYIVVRFLVNCKGKTGRYRAEALQPDFSPTSFPSDLKENLLQLIKKLDNWKKPYSVHQKDEYMKFINLKIENGQIQHILL